MIGCATFWQFTNSRGTSRTLKQTSIVLPFRKMPIRDRIRLAVAAASRYRELLSTEHAVARRGVPTKSPEPVLLAVIRPVEVDCGLEAFVPAVARVRFHLRQQLREFLAFHRLEVPRGRDVLLQN